MPTRFTYDLLWLLRNTFRDTDNLTSNGSLVHRLIEQLIIVSVIITCVQHSVDYWIWADLIALESERLLKSVVRVERPEDADLFYGLSNVAMFYKLPLAHKADKALSLYGSGWEDTCKTCNKTKWCRGSVYKGGDNWIGREATSQIGKHKSFFCLSLAGDTLSFARLFDVIVSGCIPVRVNDELELPFEGILDYRKVMPNMLDQLRQVGGVDAAYKKLIDLVREGMIRRKTNKECTQHCRNLKENGMPLYKDDQ
ncbi:hypothetical protein SADUNF_Sadunf19G0055400 [Salix dunnii]|uniref:Exostosin GT47 domain-containing protein n=1 Tax=Salix dunnii TaxID=1413687 RepID=A0A835J1Y0_9ROSI|nr:hypothetical protein SADUNF_Sadunf19G0055400 [Salix dunnii]